MLENANQLRVLAGSVERGGASRGALPMMGASLLKTIPSSNKEARRLTLGRIFKRISEGGLYAYNYSATEPYSGSAEEWLKTRLEHSGAYYYCGQTTVFNLRLVASGQCPIKVLSCLNKSLQMDLTLAQDADIPTEGLVQAIRTVAFHSLHRHLGKSVGVLEEWLEERRLREPGAR